VIIPCGFTDAFSSNRVMWSNKQPEPSRLGSFIARRIMSYLRLRKLFISSPAVRKSIASGSLIQAKNWLVFH
jgi:hypothetical protein